MKPLTLILALMTVFGFASAAVVPQQLSGDSDVDVKDKHNENHKGSDKAVSVGVDGDVDGELKNKDIDWMEGFIIVSAKNKRGEFGDADGGDGAEQEQDHDVTTLATPCQKCSNMYKNCKDHCLTTDCLAECKAKTCKTTVSGKTCSELCLWYC